MRARFAEVVTVAVLHLIDILLARDQRVLVAIDVDIAVVVDAKFGQFDKLLILRLVEFLGAGDTGVFKLTGRDGAVVGIAPGELDFADQIIAGLDPGRLVESWVLHLDGGAGDAQSKAGQWLEGGNIAAAQREIFRHRLVIFRLILSVVEMHRELGIAAGVSGRPFDVLALGQHEVVGGSAGPDGKGHKGIRVAGGGLIEIIGAPQGVAAIFRVRIHVGVEIHGAGRDASFRIDAGVIEVVSEQQCCALRGIEAIHLAASDDLLIFQCGEVVGNGLFGHGRCSQHGQSGEESAFHIVESRIKKSAQSRSSQSSIVLHMGIELPLSTGFHTRLFVGENSAA